MIRFLIKVLLDFFLRIQMMLEILEGLSRRWDTSKGIDAFKH